MQDNNMTKETAALIVLNLVVAAIYIFKVI